ncbi:NAD(P)/FAD-dependent oxidoreductase [Pseudomonas sp. SWI44]|uniref:flavin-containing monooxygenase n=1 Tax=Pseudomonas sp. SWI44 TaxID=2083053 RepID=UPI000CE5E1AD|nr:NAD(P)/FAD-dependent oxidoreductase [Pseudomonas sp. SWI44]AVD89988.1 cyclohexanone monooxygenase [Pseudomonas sp. SWI44]
MNNASAVPSHTLHTYDAVIIGAGIGGLYQLYTLREAGLKVLAIDAGTNVGGTWYWNRYPGARVDSPSHVYQYWFSEALNNAWDWSERFPAQPETERYLNFVADRFDLRKDIQFSTRVQSCTFDEAKGRWQVVTDQGAHIDAKYLISCAGTLSTPLKNLFEGEQDFQGQVYHTARWPKQPVDFTGKRVGVVGTGATGIQVVQTIAPQVGSLTVFQRTAPYTIPMRNQRYTDQDRARLKARFHEIKAQARNSFVGFDFDFTYGSYHDASPQDRREVLEMLWDDGSLALWAGSYGEIFNDQAVNNEVSAFVRQKMAERIKDPALIKQLVPTDYGFGTRRVPLDTGYLETFLRPNVKIVDIKAAPIERIVANGVQTADGAIHELDVLILATGFDASTGALTQIDIRGRDGQLLRDEWSQDLRTTLGLMVHKFPNLFLTAAPLSPGAALCNAPTCLQHQVEWITACIQSLEKNQRRSIEPTLEQQDQWVAHHDEMAATSLLAKTRSWYTGGNVAGKPKRLLAYAGGVNVYREHCDAVAAEGYTDFRIN